MEHLYSMKCKNKVPLYDLLLEMLDAHRLHCPIKSAHRENSPGPPGGSGPQSWAAGTAEPSAAPLERLDSHNGPPGQGALRGRVSLHERASVRVQRHPQADKGGR
ncbi:hypothetical protein CRUP_007918 [Coryphaenoides rupestris]|nr:hypothetical protein CRUP_007918 [Coryphaenoides rupestris]